MVTALFLAGIMHGADPIRITFDAVIQKSTKIGEQGPTVEALWVEKAPVMDGTLNDPAWTKAPVVKDFLDIQTGKPSPEATEMRLLADDENLYFGFKCYKGDLTYIEATFKNRGEAIWRDESVEIFLDPSQTGKTVYQFVFNTAAACFERKSSVWLELDPTAAVAGTMRLQESSDVEWRGNWEAKTARQKDFWTIVIRMPAADVTPFKRLMRGSEWNYLVTRNAKLPNKTFAGLYKMYTTSPFSGQWHDPRTYGHIRLGKGLVRVDIEPGNILPGKNEATFSLKNQTDKMIRGVARIRVKLNEAEEKKYESKVTLQPNATGQAAVTYELPDKMTKRALPKGQFPSRMGDNLSVGVLQTEFLVEDNGQEDLLAGKSYDILASPPLIGVAMARQEFLTGDRAAEAHIQLGLAKRSLENLTLGVRVEDQDGTAVFDILRTPVTSDSVHLLLDIPQLKEGVYDIKIDLLGADGTTKIATVNQPLTVNNGPGVRP